MWLSTVARGTKAQVPAMLPLRVPRPLWRPIAVVLIMSLTSLASAPVSATPWSDVAGSPVLSPLPDEAPGASADPASVGPPGSPGPRAAGTRPPVEGLEVLSLRHRSVDATWVRDLDRDGVAELGVHSMDDGEGATVSVYSLDDQRLLAQDTDIDGSFGQYSTDWYDFEDVDGDGTDELLYTRYGWPLEVVAFDPLGEGQLWSWTSPQGGNLERVVRWDVDGDGVDELVVVTTIRSWSDRSTIG